MPKKNSVTFWKNFNKNNIRCANSAIFRMLSNYSFKYKKKNILDLGFGHGEDLAEFKKRGSYTYGVEIKKKLISKVIKSKVVKSKNTFLLDLNKSFPKMKNKMDLILIKDTLYYLDTDVHSKLIGFCKNNLKKNGLVLIHYIQSEYVREKKIDNFDYNIRQNFKKLKKYHVRKNPVKFLKKKHIQTLIKYSELQLIENIFDVTNIIKDRNYLIINRYILMKRK